MQTGKEMIFLTLGHQRMSESHMKCPNLSLLHPCLLKVKGLTELFYS
jgi:hypothetical protein